MSSIYTAVKAIDDIESVDVHNRSPSADQVTTKPQLVRHSGLRKCLRVTLVVIGVLLAVLIALCIFSYVWLSGQVYRWTTPISHGLPSSRVSDADLVIFKDQARSFNDLLQTGVIFPDDLIVTEQNLNGLAYASDFLKGNMNTHLKTNQATIEISLPMDNFPGGKGRYLVGKETFVWVPETSEIHTKLVLETSIKEETFFDATFHLSRDYNKWNLMLVSAYFAPKEWFAPKDFLDEHDNLLYGVYNCDGNDEDCQQVRNVLNRLHKVILKEKQVIFRAGPEEDTAPHHNRVLAATTKTASYEPGWKVNLARHLVGF